MDDKLLRLARKIKDIENKLNKTAQINDLEGLLNDIVSAYKGYVTGTQEELLALMDTLKKESEKKTIKDKKTIENLDRLDDIHKLDGLDDKLDEMKENIKTVYIDVDKSIENIQKSILKDFKGKTDDIYINLDMKDKIISDIQKQNNILNSNILDLKEKIKNLKLQKGEQGKQGETGKSAYEIACELGFKGSKEEWIKSLHGKDGKDIELRGMRSFSDAPKDNKTYARKNKKWVEVSQEHQDISGKEDKTNKVTSIDNTSTDTQYPSAKCVYDSQETQDEEIEVLQTENKRLKAMLPTTTATGQDITLNKTAKLDFVKPPLPMGNSEQESTPSPDYPQEIKNVTGNVEIVISNSDNTESKTLPLSLGNIELCKIGNYQDYFYKNDDKWYKHNAINKMILDGSETWGLQSINSYGIANFQKSQSIDTIAGQANLSFNDSFSPQTTLIGVTKDVGYFLNTAKVLFIRFNSSIANTAAIFKTWLSQHNVTLYYVLGEATSTEITDVTLISQLEAISNAISCEEQTNIRGSSDGSNPIFSVEAYQNTKVILAEKYTKPSGGIPKTDLVSSVQTSLGKADTALQSYTETDPTVPNHVKNITQANITSWNNKADAGDIPTELSDLSDDSTHRLVTDTEKTAWNGKANKSDIPKYYHGTCATAAATRLKVVECEGFVLEEGATISVTFTNAQTYNGAPQLNVNGTGAIGVQSRAGVNGVRYMWSAGEIIDFTYDGTYWVCHGRGFATTSYYGVTKLATSAGSDSQAYALTPRSLYYFANYSIAPYYSSSKTYAVGDKVRYTYYIYECITAIETPESWNAEHWKEVPSLQEQIDDLKNRISNIENLLSQ